MKLETRIRTFHLRILTRLSSRFCGSSSGTRSSSCLSELCLLLDRRQTSVQSGRRTELQEEEVNCPFKSTWTLPSRRFLPPRWSRGGDSATLNRLKSSRPHTGLNRGSGCHGNPSSLHREGKTARQQKRPARGGGVSGGGVSDTLKSHSRARLTGGARPESKQQEVMQHQDQYC